MDQSSPRSDLLSRRHLQSDQRSSRSSTTNRQHLFYHSKESFVDTVQRSRNDGDADQRYDHLLDVQLADVGLHLVRIDHAEPSEEPRRRRNRTFHSLHRHILRWISVLSRFLYESSSLQEVPTAVPAILLL